jgi:alpha-glucosidase
MTPSRIRRGGSPVASTGQGRLPVPIPWSGDESTFGVQPERATAPPWLPRPASRRTLTVEAQAGDPGSMLELYRGALRIRRTQPTLGDGDLARYR